MKWDRIEKRARDHAHKLRQAFASAIELHSSRKWGAPEIEAAGLRDYARVFGHEIAAKTFWRLFNRVIERDKGAADFQRLELYLPAVVSASKPTAAFERLKSDLPNLARAVLGVTDPSEIAPAELHLVWLAACEEWKRLIDTGASEAKAQKIVLSALQASGLELAKSPRALRVTLSRKIARWMESGCASEALRDQRSDKPSTPLPISDEDRKALIARALTSSLPMAWRELLGGGRLSRAATQVYVSNPASKSYVPRRIRELVTPDIRMLEDIHHGPRQANLKGAHIIRDWSGVLPGDWYSADDTTLPLYYWQEDDQGRPAVMRGQCLLMNDCRTNRILAFALHSERNYTARVIRGLILEAHDTYGLPRQGFFFERGTWANAKLIKGSKESADAVSPDETELGLREWVQFKHAKPGNARAKTIERIIGLIQDRMEDQPGYCGRNEQTEKFERVQRALLDIRAGRVAPEKHLLHRDEWFSRLHDLCDAYNHEQQQGRMLGGLSPREAWEKWTDPSRPLMRLTPETRYLLAHHRRPLKVSSNGICVQIGRDRHWFRNEVSGRFVGRIVQVYFNPDDLSSIFIKQEIGDRSASVIPAAVSAPAMNASREQLQAAQASVNAHNAPARTLYKAIRSYFPDNKPTIFRQVVADEATVKLGQEIAEDQAAIHARQDEAKATRRQLARFERKHGAPVHDTVSDERKLTGYQLLEEANNDV